MSENSPANHDLWDRIQKLTRGDVAYIIHNKRRVDGPNGGKGFKKHPSAYSNGWAVKLYNESGGKWVSSKNASIALRIANLSDWFKKEDWVAIDTHGKIVGPCGQSENRPKETHKGQDPLKCLPRSKAHQMTKAERASASRRKKRYEKEIPDSKKPVHSPT